jgi:hypothetical protein
MLTASRVENYLRMAYVCQQEQDFSTLEDMGAEGVRATFLQGSGSPDWRALIYGLN